MCPLKCAEEEADNLIAGSGIMGQSKSSEQPKSAMMESEEEFLNLNMENVSNERITEDVEDIVHDLENLLGDTYNTSNKGPRTAENTSDDVALALEEFEELTKPDEGKNVCFICKKSTVHGSIKNITFCCCIIVKVNTGSFRLRHKCKKR